MGFGAGGMWFCQAGFEGKISVDRSLSISGVGCGWGWGWGCVFCHVVFLMLFFGLKLQRNSVCDSETIFVFWFVLVFIFCCPLPSFHVMMGSAVDDLRQAKCMHAGQKMNRSFWDVLYLVALLLLFWVRREGG